MGPLIFGLLLVEFAGVNVVSTEVARRGTPDILGNSLLHNAPITNMAINSAENPISALDGLLPPPNLFIVSAMLYTSDGRYLLQLRDDKPGLPLRDHWAFFGGEVEPDEVPEHAVLREVAEELTYQPRNCSWFHEAVYILPKHHKKFVRKTYFLIQIEPDEVQSMVQCEGAEMCLMSVPEILALDRIAPWDLSVVLLHSRENVLFEL